MLDRVTSGLNIVLSLLTGSKLNAETVASLNCQVHWRVFSVEMFCAICRRGWSLSLSLSLALLLLTTHCLSPGATACWDRIQLTAAHAQRSFRQALQLMPLIQLLLRSLSIEQLTYKQNKKLSYRRESARCGTLKRPFKVTQGHPCQSTPFITSYQHSINLYL